VVLTLLKSLYWATDYDSPSTGKIQEHKPQMAQRGCH